MVERTWDIYPRRKNLNRTLTVIKYLKGQQVDKELGLFVVASDGGSKELQHNVKNVLKVEL